MGVVIPKSFRYGLYSKALFACEQLVEAYRIGKLNGGSVQWEDINAAHHTAKEVLKAERKITQGYATTKIKNDHKRSLK